MNTTQISFLGEGILILACLIFGILLGRAGKPYGDDGFQESRKGTSDDPHIIGNLDGFI